MNARAKAGIARAALLALLCIGCEDATIGWEPPDPSFRDFQVVYPVLLRDCGFPDCHGDEDRFYRVWGPGRARLDPDSRAFDAVTGDEASASYAHALSMIDARRPEASPLLRKPLAVSAGGSGHGGVDRYGRDVYRTREEAGYVALERWVLSTAGDDAK
jgi:hypothetical protein